jgi:serine/threonine-protein kinase
MAHLERLKSALADRYAVESEIGRGGMAVVYLAEDLKHHRQVAIKVLHPELSASLGAERFLREIEIATKLVHPRILPIFDSGEADGFLFYVMPYIDGESLRDRLDREKQLPLEDALQIAQQVADVLSYAHDQGIVHRDIKPENILFEAGHAIVADFGIAKAIATAGGEKLTQTGLAVGTPAYMSPEQAGGEAYTDGRADLYALGCVLYEMLAGDPPFTGATSQVILARKSTESVPSLRTARETVPEGVEAVIARSLAKAPADRYPTAEAFGEALRDPPQPEVSRARRRRALILAVSAVVVGTGWVVLSTLRSASAEAFPVVAVLPCDNRSRDAEQDQVADDWSEDLIRNLLKTAQLRPRSWSTMRKYRGSERSPSEIAAEEQAGYFLNCGVDETGSEVRFVADLVRTDDEELVWANEFQDELTVAGITSMQSRVVQEIAEALGAGISSSELAQLDRLPTQSDSAYNLYLLGRRAFQIMTAESLRQSLEFYDQAIALDSTFALAYAAQALALGFNAEFASLAPRDYYPEMKRLLIQALEIDESLGPAHTMYGLVMKDYNGDWPTAEREFKRGIELEPNNANAHLFYSHGLSDVGRHDEAIAEMKIAVELEPTNSFVRGNLEFRYQLAGRYEEALEEGRRAVQADSGLIALLSLGDALSALGQYDEAIITHEAAYERYDNSLMVIPNLGYAYAMAGKRAEAEQLLAILLRHAEDSYVEPVNVARLYMGLGDHDEAIAWLEQAYGDRSLWLNTVFGKGQWFYFDALQSDPRFQDIRARVGFGE